MPISNPFRKPLAAVQDSPVADSATDPAALELLTASALQQLTDHITQSETRHTGDIRICIEHTLPESYQQRQATPRERAVMQFAKLRVWDTEHNNGILIYILLDLHAIEIVADRGYNHCVPQNVWQELTDRLRSRFQQHDYLEGLTHVLDRITDLMAQCYPADANHVRVENLPNAPVILDSRPHQH